jgi:hypothetical protein
MSGLIRGREQNKERKLYQIMMITVCPIGMIPCQIVRIGQTVWTIWEAVPVKAVQT